MTHYPYSLHLVRDTDRARAIEPPERVSATLFMWTVQRRLDGRVVAALAD
ncbi:MAG: hypothetical protein LBP86_06110 [Azoarcus sp.]|jgi:hypothetical protein|nr:hypothetical protein [Azoarcus sp.]